MENAHERKNLNCNYQLRLTRLRIHSASHSPVPTMPKAGRSAKPVLHDPFLLPMSVRQLEDSSHRGRSSSRPGLNVQAGSNEEVLRLAPKIVKSLIDAAREKGIKLTAPSPRSRSVQGARSQHTKPPNLGGFGGGRCRVRPGEKSEKVGEEGFEPPKTLVNRFTVCPDWPLRHSPRKIPTHAA